jgi:hypothetical protein
MLFVVAGQYLGVWSGIGYRRSWRRLWHKTSCASARLTIP